MSLSYFLDCLKLVRLVVVPNFRASTGGYYNLIIITRSSHFTWNVGPLWPFFSLELYTLFSIVQCRVPGVLLHGLLTCRIRAVCDGMVWYGMWAWGESLYSSYVGAIDGNADEVTEILLHSWWDKNRRTEGRKVLERICAIKMAETNYLIGFVALFGSL